MPVEDNKAPNEMRAQPPNRQDEAARPPTQQQGSKCGEDAPCRCRNTVRAVGYVEVMKMGMPVNKTDFISVHSPIPRILKERNIGSVFFKELSFYLTLLY